MKSTVSVVMRAHNDMPHLLATIQALRTQTLPFQLVAFDNASTDGGREVLDRLADQVFHVPEGSYMPGQVLNAAMQHTSSEVVVFLNADCQPLNAEWLSSLLDSFKDPAVGAAFGRQLPRSGCHPLPAFDTEATYGNGSQQASWRHCFSMASCALRRSLWNNIRFDESLRYSEDIAWSWRVRQSGNNIRYVPASCVLHSHNYTNSQWYKRQYGEGRAEAAIFAWSPWQRTLLRYSVLPFFRQIMRDTRSCISTKRYSGLMDIPGYRLAQTIGRRRGFLAGWNELKTARRSSLTAGSL